MRWCIASCHYISLLLIQRWANCTTKSGISNHDLKICIFFYSGKKKGRVHVNFMWILFLGFVWCSSCKKVKGRLNKETREYVRRRFYVRIFLFPFGRVCIIKSDFLSFFSRPLYTEWKIVENTFPDAKYFWYC